MLTQQNLSKNQVKRILELLDEYTKVEVALRLGVVQQSSYTTEAHHLVEVMNELREMAYGTSCLVGLSDIFGFAKRTGKHTAKMITKKKVKQASDVATSPTMQTTKKKKKKKVKVKIRALDEDGISDAIDDGMDDIMAGIMGGD